MSGSDETLHHTCFLVHDVEATARSLSTTTGIGPWNLWTLEPETHMVRGKDVPFAFRVALAEVGGSNYELVQPAGGESLYVEDLRTRGEGFHHTCITYESREAMLAAKQRYLDNGCEIVQSAGFGELGEFFYFQVAGLGIVELLFLRADLLPPPELTIG